MGYLVCKGKAGVVSFSGTQYVNPTNGTKRLCIRTGTKPTDIVKYGLTTNSSASNYCGMRMKINGNTAYIGRIEAPIITRSVFNSTISTKRGTSTLGTYFKTIKYTQSVSSTASGSYVTRWASGTYTYTAGSVITSVNDKRCTQIDKYRTGTVLQSLNTTITLARNSTVQLSQGVNYITLRYYTRELSFGDDVNLDGGEDNFNL